MASARKKKTRSRPNLSAERIRDEALRLIEAEGLEEFSTRMLGRALGVEAMAIYWYYPSKDALLDAVVELLVSKIGDAVPSGSRGRPGDFIDALRKLAQGYRALAHDYPRAFPLLATRRWATSSTSQFLDNLFALAESNGLDAKTTARFYRLVAAYCNGIALDELAGMRETKAKRSERDKKVSPRVAKVSEWLAPEHHDQVFAFGLDLLLSALREKIVTATPKSGSRSKSTATRVGRELA